MLNRAVARLPLFHRRVDYAACERVMLEANERHPTRILAWCLMRNHWHFLIWPRRLGAACVLGNGTWKGEDR
ncbi:MAG: transposase [Planctomycetes bacterium]|nr:transposase [Planctomycetota bacterium]